MDGEMQKEPKDTTIKVFSDTRDKLKVLTDRAGKNSANDFLNELMDVYEATKLRDDGGIDIVELSQLQHHLQRIEAVYVSMAKSRFDIQEQAKTQEQELTENIKMLKAELLDTRETTKAEIEAAQAMMEVFKAENAGLSDQTDKAIADKIQIQRAYEKLEAFNQQLHAQAEELKNTTARAQKEAAESQESAKTANNKTNAAEREKEAIQNKLASANNEIERLQQELLSSKELLENQINKTEENRAALLEKLDSEREMKNQAIGQRDILLKEVEQYRKDRADDNQKINQLQLEILNLKTTLQAEK